MYRVHGTIEGIADLLFNRPGEIVEEIEDSPKPKAAGRQTLEEKRQLAVKDKLHRDGSGHIIIPPSALLEALFAGANRAGLKDGKRSLSGTLEAICFIEGTLLVNGGTDKPDYVHECWGRIPPRTGGMVVLCRPAFHPGWTAAFTMMVADDRIPQRDVRSSLDHAGLLVGIGAWRPQLGRFKVTAWDVAKL